MFLFVSFVSFSGYRNIKNFLINYLIFLSIDLSSNVLLCFLCVNSCDNYDLFAIMIYQ